MVTNSMLIKCVVLIVILVLVNECENRVRLLNRRVNFDRDRISYLDNNKNVIKPVYHKEISHEKFTKAYQNYSAKDKKKAVEKLTSVSRNFNNGSQNNEQARGFFSHETKIMSSAEQDFNPFQELLSDVGDIDKIYDALGKDDLSDVVVTTMNALEQTVDVDFRKHYKLDEASEVYRNEGNKFYSAKKFRPALEYYNRALLYAPKNSQAMKLAYSNRSALLFTVRAYTACIKDINTVFSIGCTDHNLAKKLQQRKRESLKSVRIENLQSAHKLELSFFDFDVKRHPQIPCASKSVDVVYESGLPKIVAARNIPVGELVAIEKPFVSALHEENYFISCHYCQQLSLNLIPCDGCCVALFCNEECQKECKKEYHDIECTIIHNNNKATADGSASEMALRAALKMRQMCKSWKELIDASKNIGEDRMRTSSIRDNYDIKSKFSLLSHNNSNHFMHGKIFNQSFFFPITLRNLANLPSFFPKEADEKEAAIRAFARIMMHLYTSYRKIKIVNAAEDVSSGNLTTNIESNSGWFSFAGKLKHCCNANLLCMALKNKIALVAIRPIEKGDELTISFLGHYYEYIQTSREYNLFCITQNICKCRACVEKWSVFNLRKMKLTEDQAKAYWISASRVHYKEYREGKSVFEVTCEGLTRLEDAACTAEHYELYKEFRKLTTIYQFLHTDNKFIMKDDYDDSINKKYKVDL